MTRLLGLISLCSTLSVAVDARAAEKLVFEETFDNNERGWLSYDAAEGLIAVRKGVLAVETRVATTFVTTVPHRLDDDRDWRIEVTLKSLKGQENGYGLVFGFRSTRDQHRFIVYGNGYFSLFSLIDGKSHDVTGSMASAKINQGPTATNRLSIAKTGDRFILAINGHQVDRVKAFPLLGAGIGVAEGQISSLEADDLRVYEVTPEAPQPVPSAVAEQPAERKVVAIFEFQDASKKLRKETLDQLAEYLGALLAKKGKYAVLPRDQMKQQIVTAKSDSFKACFDSSCQIELGKALAAEAIISTKILRVGKECVLTSTLFDLRTETMVRAATMQTSCAEKALITSMQNVADQL